MKQKRGERNLFPVIMLGKLKKIYINEDKIIPVNVQFSFTLDDVSADYSMIKVCFEEEDVWVPSKLFTAVKAENADDLAYLCYLAERYGKYKKAIQMNSYSENTYNGHVGVIFFSNEEVYKNKLSDCERFERKVFAKLISDMIIENGGTFTEYYLEVYPFGLKSRAISNASEHITEDCFYDMRDAMRKIEKKLKD